MSVDGKMILAADLVRNPGQLDSYAGKYVVIYDQSVTSFKWDNLVKAMNIAAGHGWRSVNISTMQATGGLGGMYAYVIMERT